MIPANVEILIPWSSLDRLEEKGLAEHLSAELEREVSPGHVLYKMQARPVARRVDRDDILFEVDDQKNCLAVVHLTWHRESDSRWPTVKLFVSWDQWVREEMMPAHEEYMLA